MAHIHTTMDYTLLQLYTCARRTFTTHYNTVHFYRFIILLSLPTLPPHASTPLFHTPPSHLGEADIEIFDLDRLHIILQATLLTGLFVARHLRDHDGVDQLLERRDNEGVDHFGQAGATQLGDHPGPREAWRVAVNVCSKYNKKSV